MVHHIVASSRAETRQPGALNTVFNWSQLAPPYRESDRCVRHRRCRRARGRGSGRGQRRQSARPLEGQHCHRHRMWRSQVPLPRAARRTPARRARRRRAASARATAAHMPSSTSVSVALSCVRRAGQQSLRWESVARGASGILGGQGGGGGDGGSPPKLKRGDRLCGPCHIPRQRGTTLRCGPPCQLQPQAAL